MADETTTTTTSDGDERPHEPVVSYDRFKAVNDKLAEERKQRAELEGRISQLEDADKPHIERLTKDLERAQKRADEAEKASEAVQSQLARSEKSAWLSNAAAKLNFHDPDIAARMVDLDTVEDATSAEKIVKGLAKDKAFLVKEDQKQSPLQRVGIAGAEHGGGQQQQGLITPEQQEREWGQDIYKGLTERSPLPGGFDDE